MFGDDARKSNHIGWSIIKTTLSTFVSFLLITTWEINEMQRKSKVDWLKCAYDICRATSYKTHHFRLFHSFSFTLSFSSSSSLSSFPIKKQQQWTDIWQLWVLALYPFWFDRITCSFGISNFAAVIVARRMSSDRQACDIYACAFADCLRNDLTGLIYHKLSSTVIEMKTKATSERFMKALTKKRKKRNHSSLSLWIDLVKRKEWIMHKSDLYWLTQKSNNIRKSTEIWWNSTCNYHFL